MPDDFGKTSILRLVAEDCAVLVRAGGKLSNDTVGHRAELLKKIEACKRCIGQTQVRIDARKGGLSTLESLP
jgi:hypothetical protein